MPVPDLPRRTPGQWFALAAVAVGVVLVDQLTKDWAVRELPGRTIALVWTLQLNLTYNTGTAFSLGGDRGPLIAIAALTVVGFVVYTGRNDSSKLGTVARGLVVGGAFGNLIDRLVRDGQLGHGILGGRVVDFIDVQWWPVFNIADTAVVIGCGLLVISLVKPGART